MKKHIKTALVFAILGLAAGVFYREYSKICGVTAQYTVLGQVHPHLIGLGVFGVLLIGLVNQQLKVQTKAGMRWYLTGTAGMAGMLLVRGVLDMKTRADAVFAVSRGLDAGISGIAGLFHIAVAVGMVLILRAWLKAAEPA